MCMFLFKLSLKNILRNKTKSFIIGIMIVIASVIMVFGSAYSKTIKDRMLNDCIHIFAGHLQIRKNTTKEVKKFVAAGQNPCGFINNYEALVEALRQDKDVAVAVPRIQIESVMTRDGEADGCILVGIDALNEPKVSTKLKIKEGKHLKDKENGILITKKMKTKLKCTVGDYVTLICTGENGEIAQTRVMVKGVVEAKGRDAFFAHMCYMDISMVEKLNNVGKKINHISILLKNPSNIDQFINNWNSTLKLNNLRAYTYAYLTQDYVAVAGATTFMINGASISILILILLNIINIATISVYERKSEIGTFCALGCSQFYMQMMIMIEFFSLGVISCTLGVIIGVILVRLLSIIGIPAQNDALFFVYGGKRLYNLDQSISQIFSTYICIVIISVIASAIAASKLLKLDIIESLRAE